MLVVAKLVRASEGEKLAEGRVLFSAQLGVGAKTAQKLFDSPFAQHQGVRIFLLETEESFLWRQHWDEKAWVLTAKGLPEQVKITVSAVNLGHSSIRQKV